METFYQIVTKQEIDGNWVGFFTENSEIYKTEDDAYKAVVDLANKYINKRFNDHLESQYSIEDKDVIVQIFNPRINDVEKEYYIQELTVTTQNNEHLNMEKFANHIIAIAHKYELPITNIKLQKIMYFTFKFSKNENLIDENILKRMYDQHFEISAFGPVVREQYSRFENFMSAPIIGSFKQHSILNPLNPTIVELLKINTSTLINLSMGESFWIENHAKINKYNKTIEYQFEDI